MHIIRRFSLCFSYLKVTILVCHFIIPTGIPTGREFLQEGIPTGREFLPEGIPTGREG